MLQAHEMKFIHDPGHGWLRVPIASIEGMSLTAYSFFDENFAYLEEDCDVRKFIEQGGTTLDNVRDAESMYVDHFDRGRPGLPNEKPFFYREHIDERRNLIKSEW